MSQLKTYHMRLCPLTKKKLKTMNDSGIKLRSLKLWVDQQNDIQKQASLLLQSSSFDRSLKVLSIADIEGYKMDSNFLNSVILNVSRRFNQLVKLGIQCYNDHYGYDSSAFLNIVPNFPSFEYLSFDTCDFKPKKDIFRNYTSTKLKSLYIRINYYDRENTDDLNDFFYNVIGNSPSLQRFNVAGQIHWIAENGCCVDLNFIEMDNMKSIEVNLDDCGYYIFTENGKRWKGY